MTALHRTDIRDLLLPIAVVAVVGLMIFPLPSVALDSLLTCNIAFSLMLLVSSVYLREPEKFTSLPTILLLSTLFRLGLNISTTRKLLATGEAPEIVVAFGNFVVNGNLIVGIVVFIIVTTVQFLVIAKGAERVAEVAARFTLDAMPGRQMSIDGDVRAGVLTLAEARVRRQELQRESKLYGALDGAMKFVKGDAIAGLIIIVINIIAGLALGVSQQGLSISQALHKYTIFTIGDGLVSQIPALLVAVAAGITVTRVTDVEYSFIGRDVFSQLGREPQALATTAVVLFMLALVPGLPAFPFVVMAGLLSVSARGTKLKQKEAAYQQNLAHFRPQPLSPIAVHVSACGLETLQKEQKLLENIRTLRNGFFQRLGVIVPDVHFEIDSTQPRISAKIFLDGLALKDIEWPQEESLVTTIQPNTEKSRTQNTFSEVICSHVREFFEIHFLNFINDTHTRLLLEIHQARVEDLINSTVPNVISITGLTVLLRQLLAEQVSIKDLPTILQAIAEHSLNKEKGNILGHPQKRIQREILAQLKADKDEISSPPFPTDLPEILSEVRIALRRTICRGVVNELGEVHAWILNPKLDHLLGRIAYAGMPPDPALIEKLLRALENLPCDLAPEKKNRQKTVIVTSTFARAALTNLLRESSKLQVHVLASEELSEEVTLIVEGEFGGANEPQLSG